jgi:hypothetical protein
MIRHAFACRSAAIALVWLLLTVFSTNAQLVAATVRWTGAAQDVRQVDTITVTGTWATGDTATLTINHKSLTVTVGAATSTSNVADILARAVDAASATEDLAGTESRNFGGGEIGEFAELDASASGAVLTLSSATAGVPFTLTRSEATAGDGALGAVTSVTAATGKNWLDNPANWEGGAFPTAGDTARFDTGDVDVLYGLDELRTQADNVDVTVTGDYTGQIGLPPTRAVGELEYVEYRPRYLQFYSTAQGANVTITEGALGLTTQGSLRIEGEGQAIGAITISGGRGAASAVPNIFVAGGDVGTINITKGSVSLDPYEAEIAAGDSLQPDTQLAVGRSDNGATDCYVIVSDKFQFDAFDELAMRGGTLVLDGCNLTKATGSPVFSIYGGTTQLNGTFGTGARVTTVHAGTLYVNGGTHTKLIAYKGTISFEQAQVDSTVTSAVLYAGATYSDPHAHAGSVINLVGCDASEVTLNIPKNKKLTLSTAAP